jgi:hypothetical protein
LKNILPELKFWIVPPTFTRFGHIPSLCFPDAMIAQKEFYGITILTVL